VITLLWVLALHVFLTAVPFVAVALIARRLGVQHESMLVITGLLGSGAAAMVTFWAYFAASSLGRVCSYAILIGSIAVIALWARGMSRELLSRLGTPLLLWSLGVAFVVSLGFLHGGTAHPLATAALRFSHQLPNDNALPFDFGGWIFTHGHQATAPPINGYVSSDRPPLQMGYALQQRVFRWDNAELHYQVLGVALQQLWIIGLWALLVAARVRVVTRALAVIAVLVSSVAIVHGFFVWPKLLGATFLLAAAALIFTPSWSVARRRPGAALLLGGLFALAMLSHGTSLFGIVALVVIVIARGIPSWRWLAVGALSGAVLFTPWLLYQRYFDPPGTASLKEAFAGVKSVGGRGGTTQAIIDAYQEAGVSGVAENKGRNFVAMTTGYDDVKLSDLTEAMRLFASGDLSQAVRVTREVWFFTLLLSFGFFLLAPILMLIGRARGRPESEDWTLGVICLACVVAGCVLWGLLMFGPYETVIHRGSLALPILAIAGAVAGMRAVFPRLAVVVVLGNVVAVLLLHVPALDPWPGTRYSPWAGTVVAASLLAFVAIAFRFPRALSTIFRDPSRAKTSHPRW
jgi:hypothetical protein